MIANQGESGLIKGNTQKEIKPKIKALQPLEGYRA
jgi:hypothetical protein